MRAPNVNGVGQRVRLAPVVAAAVGSAGRRSQLRQAVATYDRVIISSQPKASTRRVAGWLVFWPVMALEKLISGLSIRSKARSAAVAKVADVHQKKYVAALLSYQNRSIRAPYVAAALFGIAELWSQGVLSILSGLAVLAAVGGIRVALLRSAGNEIRRLEEQANG